MIRNYLQGLTSKLSVQQILFETITDLPLLIAWYAQNWSKASLLSQWIREDGAKEAKKFSDHRDQFVALVEMQQALGLPDQQIRTGHQDANQGHALS
ncbi:MAG: hypothetical protein IPJ25_14945 [Rhodocyclaceae bacterium]|nr:hypothetical protein [Rhodocyclaceae bacterium]